MGQIPIIDTIAKVVINPIIEILFVIAFAVFLWGVAQMVFNNTSAKAAEDGKKHITWGVVGLFIMTAAFGILNLISGTVQSLGK